jgi:hypothetical protein
MQRIDSDLGVQMVCLRFYVPEIARASTAAMERAMYKLADGSL